MDPLSTVISLARLGMIADSVNHPSDMASGHFDKREGQPVRKAGRIKSNLIEMLPIFRSHYGNYINYFMGLPRYQYRQCAENFHSGKKIFIGGEDRRKKRRQWLQNTGRA
jgi:hypothetical protein